MGHVVACDELREPVRPMNFAGIYETELAYVWHTLRRLGVPAGDREDLAHDVFLVVHRRLHTYDPARSLRAWLFGIAYRVVSDHRRSARFRREVVTETAALADRAVTGAESAGESALVARENRALVLAGLASLSMVRRAVFIMHDLDGMSIPEIAEVIDAPKNTLYSHLRRARRDFSAAVKQLRQGDSR